MPGTTVKIPAAARSPQSIPEALTVRVIGLSIGGIIYDGPPSELTKDRLKFTVVRTGSNNSRYSREFVTAICKPIIYPCTT